MERDTSMFQIAHKKKPFKSIRVDKDAFKEIPAGEIAKRTMDTAMLWKRGQRYKSLT